MSINLKRYYLFSDAFYKYILLYTSYYIIAHSRVCVRTRLLRNNECGCYDISGVAAAGRPAQEKLREDETTT